MANQLQTLLSLVGRGSEIAERLSPATSLTLVVGFDQDGWEDWRIFSVGDRVISRQNRLYQVIGFTLNNNVIVRPIGLDADPATRTVEFIPTGLRHETEISDEIVRHQTGLVDLVG